jgi:hypothetical protein
MDAQAPNASEDSDLNTWPVTGRSREEKKSGSLEGLYVRVQNEDGSEIDA